MKLVDLNQGSKEWREFRRSKIGSSDAAIIMGLNPYGKTPHKLWRQKIEGTEDAVNPAMQRGIDLEPIARNKFIEEIGVSVFSATGVSEENIWQMASFDGVSEDGSLIVELKCGGSDLYEAAVGGNIPAYYMCQIQHQISVARPTKAYYGCYYEGRIQILEVKPDSSFIEDLIEKEREFWKLLEQRIPPELSDRDYETFEHTRGSQLLQEYFLLGEQEKDIKKRKDSIKEELIEIGPKRNFILNGTKIFQTQNSSYDTKRMREDGIDVDVYKKLSNPYWMISSSRASRGAA